MLHHPGHSRVFGHIINVCQKPGKKEKQSDGDLMTMMTDFLSYSSLQIFPSLFQPQNEYNGQRKYLMQSNFFQRFIHPWISHFLKITQIKSHFTTFLKRFDNIILSINAIFIIGVHSSKSLTFKSINFLSKIVVKWDFLVDDFWILSCKCHSYHLDQLR